MKRDDRVVLPDSYEHYERMQNAREVGRRLDTIEEKLKELENWLLDK